MRAAVINCGACSVIRLPSPTRCSSEEDPTPVGHDRLACREGARAGRQPEDRADEIAGLLEAPHGLLGDDRIDAGGMAAIDRLGADDARDEAVDGDAVRAERA